MRKTGLFWMIFPAPVLLAAAAGLWFLYWEGDLPAPVVLEELGLPPSPRVELPESEPVEMKMPVEVDSAEPMLWPDGVVPGELVLGFRDRADLEAFLREARRAGLTDLEVLPELGLVRVRTKNDDETRTAWRLGYNAEVALNPFVATPEVPPEDDFGVQYRPFGDQALGWMGIPEDNSTWGEGVRIAILDTGVGEHPSLANASITRMNLLGEGVGVGTHGTAVASLLVGQGEVRGVAPAAELLSIQVLDADGAGNAFDLARGIIAAVDAGADAVNFSLGGNDTPFLREAVLYAQQRGVLLVAASGNDGGGRSLFPAGYEGVVSVGGVDANAQHLRFSNRDADLSVVAPGYGLQVAGPDGTVMYMNGTSFGAPLVAGSAGALLPGRTAEEVAALLTGNANDGGQPGYDGLHGHGTPDLERIEWEGQPGIYDVAVAGHYLDDSRGFPELIVGVQNQGTETVGGIALQVLVNGQLQTVSIGTLKKGDVGAARILLDGFADLDQIHIQSGVSAPGIVDVRPWNNGKESQVTLSR